MPFIKIPDITIAGAVPSNGYVYSLNYKNNFDESPSELSLQLVNEAGQYNPLPKLLPGQSVDATISIGSDINFLGELNYWEVSEEVNRRILELRFIDKSVRLDRIQVSLFKRNEGRDGVKFTRVKKIIQNNIIPVLKGNQIDQGTFYSFQYQNQPINVEITRELRQLNTANYDIDKGGEIIVGEEQYIENTCSIPNVLYNFRDLLGLCSDLVYISSLNGVNDSYYNSYTGTLREVLQNWCADFGLTFYWSTILNKAVIRDAKIPYSIPDENTFNQGSIIKKNFGESREGTFAQYGVAWYEKEGSEGRRVEISSTKYFPTYYYPFTLSYIYYQGNIFDTEGNSTNAGADLRTQTEFITSALMSYYYPSFRKYYLWYTLGILSGGNLGKGAVPLGIRAIQEITGTNIVDTLINTFNDNDGTQTLGLYVAQKKKTFTAAQLKFYIGYYDPTIEQNYQEYETNIVTNYIGKFYKGPSLNYDSNTVCDKNFFYKYEMTETPGGQTYSYYKGNPPPFAQFVRQSSQLSKMDNGQDTNIQKGAQYNVMERAGGGPSHSVDEFMQQLGLYQNENNFLDQYLPQQRKIDGPLLAAFQTLFDQGKLPQGISKDNLQNLYFFMVVNKTTVDADTQISVAYNGRQINPREQIAQQQTSQNDASCTFTKLCLSEDDEINQKVQDAQKITINGLGNNGGDQIPPVGLFVGGNRGYSVTVGYNGNQIVVVAPADGNFQGYSTVTTTVQAIDKGENGEADGKIKIVKVGGVGNAAGVSQIRAVENNFTSEDLDNSSFNDIKEKANAFVNGQTVSYLGPRKFLSVTSTEFLGMPNLNQGLESVDMTIQDEGAEITYTFATNPPRIPSPNTLMAKVENRRNRNSPR